MSRVVTDAPSGRHYRLGQRLEAVFHFDEEGYTVSEWRMEPGFEGVGAHENDANHEIFRGLEGSAEVLVGEAWRRVDPGSFVRVPPGTTHDFRNRSDGPATMLNIITPGGFEAMMPQIKEWFDANGS